MTSQNWFDKNYRILMLIPIVILLVSGGFLINKLITTGEIMQRDIQLTGGKLITVKVETALTADEIEKQLSGVRIKLTKGLETLLLIEAPADADENILKNLTGITLIGEPSIATVDPVLGKAFYEQAQMSIIAAFVFMAIVAFILFRTLAPSTAVIFAALTDIVTTMAIISLLEVKLSLTVLAGLLMLIGYSVDTDILLTSRFIKKEGIPYTQRLMAAMKTGLTMTITTLAALFALYFVSSSPVLKEIAIVLIIGLFIDIPATYLTNGGILRWYIEKKEKVQ